MYSWRLMRAPHVCALTMPDLDRLARAAIAGAITRALSAAIIASEQSRLGQSVGRSRRVGGLPKRDEAHVRLRCKYDWRCSSLLPAGHRPGSPIGTELLRLGMGANDGRLDLPRRSRPTLQLSGRAGVLGEREPPRQPLAPAQPFLRRIAHEVGRNLQCRRGCLTPSARAPGTPTVRNG